MFEYEYDKAETELKEIKEKLFEYLKGSYDKDDDPEKQAHITYKYLESITDKIIKKQSYIFKFGGGGSPLWHKNILAFLSRWVSAEIKVSKLLAEELDSILDE